jgi:hypothetical protein
LNPIQKGQSISKMSAVIETPAQKSPNSFAHVKSTPSLHRKEGWDRPERSSLSGCSNRVATLYTVGHDPPMDKMHEDNIKQNVIDCSTNESMYSLERWLTEGRKEGPWNLLRPYTDMRWDVSIQKPRISGANDVGGWSMIIEIRDDNLFEDDEILNFNGSDLSA